MRDGQYKINKFERFEENLLFQYNDMINEAQKIHNKKEQLCKDFDHGLNFDMHNCVASDIVN